MKKAERDPQSVRGLTTEARSPYYTLLAELRLRALEATWSVRRPARADRADLHAHEDQRRRSA